MEYETSNRMTDKIPRLARITLLWMALMPASTSSRYMPVPMIQPHGWKPFT